MFADTSWASDLLAVIMLLRISNCISVWCSISLVCVELGWVDGDGCVWGFSDWVTFVSNVPISFFSGSSAVVLRLEPSMIAFSSICLTSPFYGNTFSKYRIWDPKDDSRAISWVSSCLFPSGPSCVIVFDSAVSDPSASICSLACSPLIAVAPPMVWVRAAIGWASGAMVADASVRVEIAACVGSKAFNTFTQDTAISWDVEELYSKIFFSINGGTGA